MLLRGAYFLYIRKRLLKMSTREHISAKMRRVHSTNTTPELLFRKALWQRGLRYEICKTELPGKPDIVLPSRRIAIFVDGDLWHGGQWQHRGNVALEDQFGITPSKEYWLGKIRRNMERVCSATNSLLCSGWTVLRFWESEIHKNLESCVETTMKVIQRGSSPTRFSLLPRKSFAEFFAGVGLMRMGLEREGWFPDFANDIEKQKKEMYCGHFEADGVPFIVKDVHKISANEVPSVTLATASFPCNDLSLAGARAGIKAGSSSAFWGFVKILDDLGERRPPLVLLENVPGFLTSHKGSDFREALITLNQLGYTVDAFFLDAVSFVPQSRQRLFVVGILNTDTNQASSDFQLTGQFESGVRPKALSAFIEANTQINWKIRPLPPPPPSRLRLKDILDNLPDDAPEWWSAERAAYLLNQMSPRHREQADRMIASSRWSYGTVFRRMRNGRSMAELRVDGIAGCLRTPRGGSGRQILFKAGKNKYFARLLTPREAARLMGADGYRINVSLNQALFGFGDAVCVPVIEWIARYYLNPVVNELLRGKPLKGLAQGA
jgi:DNA (cytosine-5)-methyltransferase 1